MNKRDYYEILGVSKNASQDEIKSSFRKLAKKYHPDVSKEENAADKFKEAQEAYAILSDESKRKQYDQFGHSAFNQAGGASGYDFSGFDFSDIFDDLFGSGFGFNFGGNSRTSNRPRKGRDTLLRMNLTFEEAVFGTKKDVIVDVMSDCKHCNGKGGKDEKTCQTCHGSGTVSVEQRTMFGTFMTKTTCSTCSGKGNIYSETCKYCKGVGKKEEEKTLEIKVPAGVDSGNQLRIGGKGEAGENGGPNGDIYVEFNVQSHPLFERDGSDIYLELPLTITEAVLGCKKEIPTLNGNVNLTIPSGTKTGDKHRLKSKGIQNINSITKGDMYVITEVVIPDKLTKEQKKLFEQLKKTDLETGNKFAKIKKYL
ncbi:MAG: molecular chaperone DnaJ [Bacilli bacterium]|nr:molecular chaperone DnaJ [Bacilli bacterium]MDD4733624.1 molecular chaperone DnaJ [Bacilli bacterium]